MRIQFKQKISAGFKKPKVKRTLAKSGRRPKSFKTRKS